MVPGSQVVLRYRDGKTRRATLVNADIDREMLQVDENGSASEVPFGSLKAVFFPQMNPDKAPAPAEGSQLAVEFADGEIIRGVAHYNPERNGFFLYPLDRSKNDRIFVVNSAIMSIEVEKL
ncbi:MAG TPA: hypothetical protein VKU62_12405 [Thermoanaerobaculia bacterium]|nr:hypothetical protein [Thermoanaerobaculia bacterium]